MPSPSENKGVEGLWAELEQLLAGVEENLPRLKKDDKYQYDRIEQGFKQTKELMTKEPLSKIDEEVKKEVEALAKGSMLHIDLEMVTPEGPKPNNAALAWKYTFRKNGSEHTGDGNHLPTADPETFKKIVLPIPEGFYEGSVNVEIPGHYIAELHKVEGNRHDISDFDHVSDPIPVPGKGKEHPKHTLYIAKEPKETIHVKLWRFNAQRELVLNDREIVSVTQFRTPTVAYEETSLEHKEPVKKDRIELMIPDNAQFVEFAVKKHNILIFAGPEPTEIPVKREFYLNPSQWERITYDPGEKKMIAVERTPPIELAFLRQKYIGGHPIHFVIVESSDEAAQEPSAKPAATDVDKDRAGVEGIIKPKNEEDKHASVAWHEKKDKKIIDDFVRDAAEARAHMTPEMQALFDKDFPLFLDLQKAYGEGPEAQEALARIHPVDKEAAEQAFGRIMELIHKSAAESGIAKADPVHPNPPAPEIKPKEPQQPAGGA